jgi:RNA polymerase sigma factor (sigma-70 family)
MREPEDNAVAAALQITPAHFDELDKECGYARNSLRSHIEPGGMDAEDTVPSAVMEANLPDPNPIGPEAIAMLHDRQNVLHDALAALNPLEQTVINAHDVEGKLQRIIAGEAGLSDSRLSQIPLRALARLRQALDQCGIQTARDLTPDTRGVTSWAQPVPAQPACV